MQDKRPERDPSSRPDAPGVPRTETRQQRIERIRAEIEAGLYETPEKLEAAIDRMMGVLVDS